MSEEQKSENTKGKKYQQKQNTQDNEDVDYWKIEAATQENPLDAPLEESSFATLFPKYREQYLREVWPLVTRTLGSFGVACELNLIEGSMSVKTTKKMFDPYMILKARDLIKLLARSIPVQQSLKILEDGVYCDIVKIKGMVRNKERFAKRRSRLIGPNGATLKAIELVTECYVMVQGNTVSIMGGFTNMKHVRDIVIDCMNNIHPIYKIKELMIRKEQSKDENLKNENWDRFIPSYKKKNVQRKKVVIKEKSEYTPFPPAQQPRKEDIEMATGEYWMKKDKTALAKHEEARKQEVREQKAEDKKKAREAEYVAPEEKTAQEKAKLDTVNPYSALQAQVPSFDYVAESKEKKEKILKRKNKDEHEEVPHKEQKKSKKADISEVRDLKSKLAMKQKEAKVNTSDYLA